MSSLNKVLSLVGTSIVAYHTGTDIFVGTDSKVYDKENPSPPPSCKIHQIGHVFFTFAKMVGNPKENFYVPNVAKTAILEGGSIKDIVMRFRQSVSENLYQLAIAIRQNDRTFYDEIVNNQSILDAIFISVENDMLFLVSQYFIPQFSPEQPGIRCEGDVLQTGDYIFLGHTQPLINFMQNRETYFQEVSPVNAIRDLIKLAIKDKPEYVGNPISILRINNKEAQWVFQNRLCPRIEAF